MSKSASKKIKVDPKLWADFKEKCRASGRSTCEVLESFFKEFIKS